MLRRSIIKTIKWPIITSTRFKSTKILGIETSCDDTSCAIVTSEARIISESTISQFKVHEPMGGIVPNLALKQHIRNLPLTVRDVLNKANLSIMDIDAIAFTRGPGLPSSLSVGLNAAKTLAAAINKPLIGVHHMEAHALTVRLSHFNQVQFPYLCLLISGGHTLIVIVYDIGKYKILGSTLDESVGESYDKVARSLKIKWNKSNTINQFTDTNNYVQAGAGPALEQIALGGDENKFKFTVPLTDMHRRKEINFSFSGLRTQVDKQISKLELDEQIQADIAASFQFTILEHLKQKLILSLQQCKLDNLNLNCIVASGGVASNSKIRNMLNNLANENGLSLYCPPARLCTDNGVMIAWTGVERYNLGLFDNLEIDFIPKWNLEHL